MSVREGEGGEGGRERREEGEECEREGVRHREEHRDRQTESSHCERVCKVHSREPARCTDVAAGARLLLHGCCCTAAAARLLLHGCCWPLTLVLFPARKVWRVADLASAKPRLDRWVVGERSGRVGRAGLREARACAERAHAEGGHLVRGVSNRGSVSDGRPAMGRQERRVERATRLRRRSVGEWRRRGGIEARRACATGSQRGNVAAVAAAAAAAVAAAAAKSSSSSSSNCQRAPRGVDAAAAS